MAHAFVYVQLHTQDLDRAREFYKSLFGWRMEDSKSGAAEYTEILVEGGGARGGMLRAARPESPSFWLPFVDVTDIEGATEKAKSLGAAVLVAPTAVPGKGTYCVIKDPTGASVALFEPNAR